MNREYDALRPWWIPRPSRPGAAIRRMLRAPLAACLVLGCAVPGLLPPALAQGPTEAEVQAAIDRGVAYLKGVSESTPRGALVALALLNAGVKADDPAVLPRLDRVRERIKDGVYTPSESHVHIYEAGVSILALGTADPVKYKPQITAIANYIIARQGDVGFWDYPQPTHGDTSISQYGILGLWEASRAGVAVPPVVWDKAAAWHLRTQTAEGGFVYHPSPAGNSGEATHTMTMAALGSLHICRRQLYPDAREMSDDPAGPRRKKRKFGVLEAAEDDEPVPGGKSVSRYKPVVPLTNIDQGIRRALRWLETRYTVESGGGWDLYYLYGMERATALAGLDELAGRNWYDDGASWLLRKQGSNGTWNDNSTTSASTSFGVLFLVRATAQMLQPKQRATRFGAGLLVGGRGLPENLGQVEVTQGAVKVRKQTGTADELLGALETANPPALEAVQAGLVDLAQIRDPKSLVGQVERLRKLASDPNPEVRRTALWAIGRTGNLRLAPLLIGALGDADEECRLEARNALLFLSRKKLGDDLKDTRAPASDAFPRPDDRQWEQVVTYWKQWYLRVRPNDERDDLQE